MYKIFIDICFYSSTIWLKMDKICKVENFKGHLFVVSCYDKCLIDYSSLGYSANWGDEDKQGTVCEDNPERANNLHCLLGSVVHQ